MKPHSVQKELESTGQRLRREIRAEVAAIQERGAGPAILQDPYGNAALTLDDEITVTVAQHRARMLEDVASAIEHIEQGQYGRCRDCGDAIPSRRLKILPTATRCVACQTAWEHERQAA